MRSCCRALTGALEAKYKWYGSERCAHAIVFGGEPPYKVRFEAALLEQQDQHPAIFFQILKHIFWTKMWYGHGCTGHHGSDAPD